MLSSTVMPVNSAMFWKVARCRAQLPRGVHVTALLAVEGDGCFLRCVDAVDDIEHGALAGTVRADDG